MQTIDDEEEHLQSLRQANALFTYAESTLCTCAQCALCFITKQTTTDWFGRGINLPQYRGNVLRKHVNGKTLEQLNSTTVESLVGVWNRSFEVAHFHTIF